MKEYVNSLKNGQVVKFRPKGNSMQGRVESGQLVTVEPVTEVSIDDIVLVKVKENYYLHLVKEIDSHGRYLIGNNKGKLNGWVKRDKIYGKCVKVEA